MKRKNIIILITFVMALILIEYFAGQKPSAPQQGQRIQTPVIQVITTPQTHPPVNYDPASTRKMVDYINNRQQLSASDLKIRDKFVKSPNPIKTADNYRIDYLSAPDEFQVDILNIDINQAKDDAVTWLKNQGVSPEGICKFPVSFYLDYGVSQQLRGLNMQFSPLPPGC